MSRWSKHWSIFPKKFGETEFLKQVGKAVGGNEISEHQLTVLIEGLISNLSIQKEDIILDLCCGNGLITRRASTLCQRITGVDQSDYLIEIAKKYNSTKNTEYLCSSIFDVDLSVYGKFTKIFMYEALQHFEENQFPDVLILFDQVTEPKASILVASVPDKNLIWEFYDTEERKVDYFRRKAAGEEAIGTWWERSYLESVALEYGYTVNFLNQNPLLHSAHYRFDMLLMRT